MALPGWRDGERAERVFVFDGGVVDEKTKERFRTPEDKREGGRSWIRVRRWRAWRPDARRLQESSAAKKTGVPVYLEHGHPSPDQVTGLVP